MRLEAVNLVKAPVDLEFARKAWQNAVEFREVVLFMQGPDAPSISRGFSGCEFFNVTHDSMPDLYRNRPVRNLACLHRACAT